MPQITNANLTLFEFEEGNPTQEKVEIKVTYNAVFSEVERNFIASSGFQCVENIQVIGVDSPLPGELLIPTAFSLQQFTVSGGSGPLTVSRTRTAKALRSALQEDPGPNFDEISCKIQISSIIGSGQFTPVRVLAG